MGLGMKAWYEVTGRFYNSGKVEASVTRIVKSQKKPLNSFRELRSCDVYKNYYETRKEAEDFVEEHQYA